MADKPHPEMGYRGCLGIIRLAEKYTHPRMEAAAELALLTGATLQSAGTFGGLSDVALLLEGIVVVVADTNHPPGSARLLENALKNGGVENVHL